MSIRRLAALAAVAAAAVFPPTAAAQAPPAGWQRGDLKPVTQPAVAGGLLVLYSSQNGGLRVVGIDPGSGRTVWSQPASPSDIAPGEAPSVAADGDTVFYLARSFEDIAVLTAVDAHTGAPRWRTTPAFYTTWPGTCPDSPAAICITGTDLDLTGGAMRFDAATGRRLAITRIGADSGREIGVGLIDSGGRDPERLVAVSGARVTWRRALERIFPRSSTDFGWIIDRFDALGLFVGSIAPRTERRGAREVFDLGRERTAAFRIADGRLAWRTRGFYACRLTLPCPGQSQSANADPSPPTLGLRTVSTGTFGGRAGSDAPFVVSRDATVRIEGFSPATGRTRWRFDAGHNVALVDASASPPQVGLETVALRDSRRRLRALDLATGARRAIAPTTAGWCPSPIEYRQTVGVESDVGTLHDYIGQNALVPCAVGTRGRLATPPTVPAFLGAIGATAAGLVAWVDRTGLFARPPATS